MEILISTLIGVALIEAYVWLDPLAKWLVDRAALQLPEENREAFTEQWMADLEAMPNSLAKIVFAYRHCTLAVEDIYQEIYRGTFEAVALKFEKLIDTTLGFDEIVERSNALVQRSERSVSKLVSVLNRSLERLQQAQPQNLHAQNAVDHFRDLNPSLATLVSESHARLEQNHITLEAFVARLRKSFAGAAEVNQLIKRRLLDDRPLKPDDISLLDSFNARLDDVDRTLETYDSLDLDLPKSIAPSLKAVLEALGTANRAVK